MAAAKPTEPEGTGTAGSFCVHFPVFGVASDGQKVIVAGGGRGVAGSNKVQAYSYDDATGSLESIACLDTQNHLVVALSYCAVADVYLASFKDGCIVMKLATEQKSLTKVLEFQTPANVAATRGDETA
eukprot:gnl/TRDRNA2_/TRDRNA2_162520_c0_seq1.p1 gnl/TRDRNA2_/TRDRNA2_162520_c0~~gnl/TRDRNA2_/TRDRNA2_162520_c0_seq1.p1  ORF type:complete len:145 (-),score=25.49 gnl/TRDRNA2_/TRDRNA2_162520_c0_seq1:27-410(-)